MQVEVTFPDVPAGPLQLRMSRSSPGRYALHEFAKNVFDVRVTDAGGQPLTVARPNPHQWDVTGHAGTVRVTYRVFGDRVDGTYLGIDRTHAHINMPAAIMWARGLRARPMTVRFEPPPGSGVARRHAAAARPRCADLHGAEPAVPDGQPDRVQRVRAAHVHRARRARARRCSGSPCIMPARDAELDAFARDVETIVREARDVFGEYPRLRRQHLHVHRRLPAVGQRRRHGASQQHDPDLAASLSAEPRRICSARSSHEFFHAWNVERIRPRSLEPFNFEDANMSGELWLGGRLHQLLRPAGHRRAPG